ncbi:hypothetical protein T4D_11420 [Trichinella pseudospiralis]|uniref:Uncharacterized protein n=1 Tax=Trichinella pseudospiralis TaxID=6337 RepID=A0A0V1FU68_TRIPS|nr:hypothetical protein T4D_11420 [Trichinella pseudospiralis]
MAGRNQNTMIMLRLCNGIPVAEIWTDKDDGIVEEEIHILLMLLWRCDVNGRNGRSSRSGDYAKINYCGPVALPPPPLIYDGASLYASADLKVDHIIRCF